MNLSPEDLLDHSTWLRRFAAALVRDRDEADDLAQDALGALATTESEVRDVRGFLVGTVRFMALNRHRSALRRRGFETEATRERSQETEATDDVAERMDVMRVVLEEVRELPTLQARTIGLRFFDELSNEEIARREGVTTSTVRSNLARGLAALRERLDRRMGGRDVWCAVLIPWLAPAPTGALFSAGAFLMFVKILVAAALPLVLFALWNADRSESAPPHLETVDAAAAPEGFVSGLDASDIAQESVGRTSAQASADESMVRSAPEAPRTNEELYALEGRVTDRATGEPVQDVRISFSRSQEGSATNDHYGEAVTRADGTFLSEHEPVPQGPLRIYISDRAGLTSVGYGFGSFELQFPFKRDIEIDLGPTFQLDYASGSFKLDEHYIIHAPSVGADSRLPQNQTVTRLAPSPWVRFASPLKGAGPWTLRLTRADGLTVGTGSLEARTGVYAQPVVVHFEERGAASFTQPTAPAAKARGLRVDLAPLQGGAGRSVALTQKDGAYTGHFGELEGGTYQWSCAVGDQVRRGTVEVRTGETSEVSLSLFEGLRATVRVLIDATAVPHVDLTESKFFVFNEANVESSYQPTPERVEGAPDGTWRIHLAGLPEAQWRLASQVADGLQVDGVVRPVAANGKPTKVLVTELATRAVTLEVTDSAGIKIFDNIDALHMDGMKLTHIPTATRGGLEAVQVPAGYATTFFVRAPGKRFTQVDYDPSQHDGVIRATLENGWRGRVFVFDMETLEFIEDVRVTVDGKEAGQTGPDGAVWIEGDGPPARIDIASDDATMEIVIHPFERPDHGAVDVLPGYGFLVRHR